MTMTPDTNANFLGAVELQQSGKFKADSPIIQKPTAARSVYESLRSGHLRRINLYKEIESLIQGSPPYDPAALRQAGLDHVANFNDMSARAVFERACLAYWNLLHNTDVMIKFTLRIRDENGNEPPELQKFAEIMARNWDFVIKEEWPSFIVNMASTTAQLVKFGVSPVVFPDERSPKWRMVELNRFFVPDQAQSDIDNLSTILIETDYTFAYLWGVYEEFHNKPDNDENPWDTEELGHLLVYLTKQTYQNDSISDMLSLKQKMLSGDLGMDSMHASTVRLISMFQREYEGKVSHYMFHRNYSHDSDKFLFKVENQYDNISRALILFTMNPGEFTIHANRGIGHKIFSLAQAKIQAGCSIIDQVKWASTPIIKAGSLTTKDVEQIKFYPGVPTNIGTCELQQNNLGANVQNSVAAANYLKSEIQYNISYSGSDPASPDPDQGSLSPSQSRLMASREFSVLKNFIMHYQATADHVFRNMVATMLQAKEGWPDYELCKRWKERCTEDGVPAFIFEANKKDLSKRTGLPRHIQVDATRVAGAGSQTAELMGLQELQAIVGSFGPKEEAAFKRRFISATLGHESVSEFTQDDNAPDERAGGASLAAVENAIMQAGKSPVFSPENDQRAHFSTHMALAEHVVQSIQQQQMDVIEADSIFSVLMPHMSEHLQALGKNVFAQQFYSQAEPSFKQLVQYASLNHKNAATAAQAKLKQQQENEQAQQQAMNAEELKTMTTLNEEKRKDFKLQAQTNRQERAGQAKETALARKTDADITLKHAKTISDITADHKKLDSELENKAVERMNEDPGQALRDINGTTPAPYDLEGVKR